MKHMCMDHCDMFKLMHKHRKVSCFDNSRDSMPTACRAACFPLQKHTAWKNHNQAPISCSKSIVTNYVPVSATWQVVENWCGHEEIYVCDGSGWRSLTSEHALIDDAMKQKGNINAKIVNIKSLQSGYMFQDFTHAFPAVLKLDFSFKHGLCFGLRHSETSWIVPIRPCVRVCLHYMSWAICTNVRLVPAVYVGSHKLNIRETSEPKMGVQKGHQKWDTREAHRGWPWPLKSYVKFDWICTAKWKACWMH